MHEISKLKVNVIGHILCRNSLLQRVIEGNIKGRWRWQDDEEGDVGIYWMTLRKVEDTVILMRKL